LALVLFVKQSSGQSDALILASSTFMVAMGLSVTAMIRVSHTKGINDYKKLIVVARSIFLLAIILETFSLLCVVLHNFLPHLFLNMNDASQVLDNSEIIAITSKLLLIAIFQISDGIQVVVLGARFARCKNPMYITFVAYWVIGFPISYYFKYTELKAVGRIGLLAGLTAAAIFLYIRFARLTKKFYKIIKNKFFVRCNFSFVFPYNKNNNQPIKKMILIILE
jgi:MATE family multidrug resistance protein